MNQKLIMSLLTAAAPLAVATQATAKEAKTASKQSQPNILCLVCEDISLYINCFGDKVAKSPNIDRLASQGIMFTDLHTTVGVSSPSRFALISGMYPTSLGGNYMRTQSRHPEQRPAEIEKYYVILPDEVKCYSEYMREAGYYCTNSGKTDYQFNAPLSAWDESGPNAHWKSCPDDMPFFSIFNVGVTHEGKIWSRGDMPLEVDPADIVVPPYYPDNDIVRHDLAVMYSNIAEMDRQVQAHIDDLNKSGRGDNTIIIWYSDNGGPMPRQKRSIYESGTHVPFVISFPDGYRAGTQDDRLAMFVDIPATILSLANIEPPKYMHGEAFLGEYAQDKERDYVYAARDRMDEKVDKQGAVRDHRYRYIRNYMTDRPNYLGVGYRLSMPMMRNMVELYEQGKLNKVQSRWFDMPRPAEEFYDDVADPHSINNLIDDPNYKGKIDRLRKEYDRWIEKYNSRWMMSEMESIKLMNPLYPALPLLNPAKITKSGDKAVITSDNAGASIVYKINGKGHTDKSWYLYTEPIEGLKSGDVVTATTTRAGYDNGEGATFTW